MLWQILKNCYAIVRITVIVLAGVFHTEVNAENNVVMKKLMGMTLEDLMEVQIITIATGTKQTVAKAPAMINVITDEDIEAMGATDLDEVLETVPGLHVARGNLYRPIYTIRGIFSEFNPEVLVLINGIPTTALYRGERGWGWGGMPMNAVSRIEVIRGPGSAIYGADAFAGVVNIFTKTKEDIQGTEVGARVGRFSTYEGWVLHSNNWHGFDIATSLEYRSTEGQNSVVEEDAQTQFDERFGTSASLAPGPVNLATDNIDARLDMKKGFWQVRAGYQGRHHLGLGAGIVLALDPVGYVNAERMNTDLTYHNPKLAANWDVTTQLSYLDIRNNVSPVTFPPGAFGGTYPDGYIGKFDLAEGHLRLDTFAFYSGLKQHLIRVGMGYHYNDQYKVSETKNYGIDPATGNSLPAGSAIINLTDTPYVFNKETQRKNGYISLQDVWTMTDQWELTAGIRYDSYSDFGDTINPRLALVWQTRSDFTSKFLYGRAFRTPSFGDLYNTYNPIAMGNPNLKPEIIDTWELAFDYRVTKNFNLATNLFTYDIADKIRHVPTVDKKTNVAQNIGNWRGSGLELEARWKINTKSNLLANYSYAKATNKKDDSDIGNYPHHSAYIRTDWLLKPHWYLNVQANWVADRQRISNDLRPKIGDYTTVDLTLRYKGLQKGHASITLSVHNLLDTDAREPTPGPDSSGMISIPYDLPLAGRNGFIEFRYQF